MNVKNTLLSITLAVLTAGAVFAQTSESAPLRDNDNKTAIEVYNVMKAQGHGSRDRGRSTDTPKVNISGYAVK